MVKKSNNATRANQRKLDKSADKTPHLQVKTNTKKTDEKVIREPVVQPSKSKVSTIEKAKKAVEKTAKKIAVKTENFAKKAVNKIKKVNDIAKDDQKIHNDKKVIVSKVNIATKTDHLYKDQINSQSLKESIKNPQILKSENKQDLTIDKTLSNVTNPQTKLTVQTIQNEVEKVNFTDSSLPQYKAVQTLSISDIEPKKQSVLIQENSNNVIRNELDTSKTFIDSDIITFTKTVSMILSNLSPEYITPFEIARFTDDSGTFHFLLNSAAANTAIETKNDKAIKEAAMLILKESANPSYNEQSYTEIQDKAQLKENLIHAINDGQTSCHYLMQDGDSPKYMDFIINKSLMNDTNAVEQFLDHDQAVTDARYSYRDIYWSYDEIDTGFALQHLYNGIDMTFLGS